MAAADSVSDNSFLFAGGPVTLEGTTAVAMAAAADALLSRNSSFASRYLGLPGEGETGDDDRYLPMPTRHAVPARPDSQDHSRADPLHDTDAFSPRDEDASPEEGARRDDTQKERDEVVCGGAVDGHRTGENTPSGGDDDEAAVVADAKPKPTPLPLVQILIIGSVLLTESLSAMMLMPFVGLFVAHLMDWTVERAGYLSGVLVGMFMLGQVLSGKLWGRISDRHGRKKPLVLGLGVGAAMMFVFGISPNIYIACAARFIHGFFNGTVLIAKTVVSDITDNSNRAKGFAWVSLAWAVGSLVGPTIGGFLYDPATNSKFASYHISKDSFLGQYPAFLPGTVLAAYIAFSFVVCLIFLEESNPTDRSARELIPSPMRRWCFRRGCCGCLTLPQDQDHDDWPEPHGEKGEDALDAGEKGETDAKRGADTSISPFAHSTATRPCEAASHTRREQQEEEGGEEAAQIDGRSDHSAAVSVPGSAEEADNAIADKFTYMDAIRYPPSRYLLLLFMLYCALEIIYSEVMPLWAVAGRDVGGLGLFSDDVAILLLVCGAPALVANLVFPVLCDRVFAHNKMLFWQISITINAVCTAIVPVAAYVHGNRGGFWFTLAVGLVRQFGLSWCFGLAQFLVPYVAKPGHVGTMFGINQAAGSATRCVIPFGAAPLFAWSVSGPGRPFPINHFLLFMICVLCAIATFILSFLMKLPVEVAYREEKRRQKAIEVQPQNDEDEPIVMEGQQMADKEESRAAGMSREDDGGPDCQKQPS